MERRCAGLNAQRPTIRDESVSFLATFNAGASLSTARNQSAPPTQKSWALGVGRWALGVQPAAGASRHGTLPRILLALLLLCATTFADLPTITLATVMPPGGKIGTDVEITINGSELEEANALLFSHPGISAKPKAEKQFVVTIAADVPPGIYDLRLVGKSGVSNPRSFAVGELPETVEKAANDKPETATELAIGSVINGTVAAATSDYFKFAAKQGQRLFVECAAQEIDSRLNPVLAVLDPGGREMESSRRGGLLDFTAPADATYLVQVRDLIFGGGPEHYFRLALTAGPRLDFVLPPSGTAGAKGKFTLYGRGLPGGAPANLTTVDGKPLEKLDVEIDVPATPPKMEGLDTPASASVDGFPYRLRTPQGASNPVFISLASTPVLPEQEPNNKPAEAQKITVPCEIAGQFFPAADVDAFTFDAKKGDIYWIEVFSSRLGLPTNPFLLVQREGGDVQEVYPPDANIGGPRFNTLHNDPATRLEVKEDGVYRVQVRDLFGNTRVNPRCVYRLSIHKEAPDFRLAAIIELPPKKDDDRAAIARAAFLHSGETIPVRVIAFRRDGFAGEIELSGDTLPEGVTCTSAKIPAGKNDTLMLLTAAEQAPRWVGPVHIVGKAKVGESELVHQARAAVVEWNVPDFNNEPVSARLAQEFALAVSGTEAAPISVEPAEEKVWEVAVGAKLDIPLKITRRDGNAEALKLKAFDAPAIEGLKEIDVDGKTPTATASIDLAAVKIPAGNYTIHFRAQSKAKFRNKDTPITVFSSPIRISVK
jgi:hypothetical protein